MRRLNCKIAIHYLKFGSLVGWLVVFKFGSLRLIINMVRGKLVLKPYGNVHLLELDKF